MKKITTFLLLVALFATSISVTAQDAKATALLDKVSNKVKSMKGLKAQFSLNVVGSNGKSNGTKKGTFLLKGNKYKIDLTEQKIICDGKSVWTYLPSNKEVQVSNYNPEEQTISPAKLFSGSYSKEYKSSYAGQKTVEGKKVDVVEMTPLKGNAFKSLLLYIDKATSMVTGGMMTDRNGGSYTYSISGVTNTDAPDNEFVFDTKKVPGIEVIDLR